jgi:hypothetical protein
MFSLRNRMRAFLPEHQRPVAANRAVPRLKIVNPKSLSRLTMFWWISLLFCLWRLSSRSSLRERVGAERRRDRLMLASYQAPIRLLGSLKGEQRI